MNVLIVDDNPTNLVLLTALAEAATGKPPFAFEDALEALGWCQAGQPDLVLVDYMMPDLNGHDFIRLFRQIPGCSEVPIVMVTTEDEREVRKEALSLGATEFLAKPVDATEFRMRVRNLLALREAQNLLRDRAKLLQREVERATAAVLERERELIIRLSKAAEYRDPETGAHIVRMSHYAVLIARRLGLPDEFQRDLLEAAPMHDIGKLGVPDGILLKAGRLTSTEQSIMRQHAEIGAQILSGSSSALIRLAEEIARSHHEKYDGTGYPLGLAGEAIPLAARIVAVADVFDALTSSRPYKQAWSVDAARAFLAEGAGKHFCPACVAAFEQAWDEVLAVMDKFPE